MGSLKLTTFQIGTPRKRGEGLRIGTVRFLPRGVYKKDWARLDYFDVWLPTVAPSRSLLDKVKRGKPSLDTFFKRYESAMRKTDAWQTIVTLAELAKRTPIAIGCYCENPRRCHRHVLERLIREAAKSPTMIEAGKRAAKTRKRNHSASQSAFRLAGLKAAATRRRKTDGATVALAVRQPFAELILRGEKTIEYRSIPTHKRETVYIYAGKQPVDDPEFWSRVGAEPGDLPTRVVVGTVEITGCRWNERDQQYEWRLARPRRLKTPRRPTGTPQPVFFKPF